MERRLCVDVRWQSYVETVDALSSDDLLHQQVRDDYPSSLAKLGDIPGLTSTHIYLLYHRAGVRSLADLRLVVHNSKQILSIPGFGPIVLARLCKTLNECQPGPAGSGLVKYP